MLVCAVVGEDVNLNLLEATEPENLAGAELGEATVADVVEILERLTAYVEELDASVLEARVDVDGEGALLVDNFGDLITDLLTEEHHVDEGVGRLTGPRGTAVVFAANRIDRNVARWENFQLIDENLPAYLGRQLVDERA